ncbi:MAG: nitroreductase family protein, partial [Acidimicrobiales bacterium]
MDFQDVLRRRRMVRSFEARPLPPGALDRIVANARRAPSAGHTQGSAFLVLEGPDQTAVFWAASFPTKDREGFRRPGLFAAAAVIVAFADRQAYADRYAEADKAGSGIDAWPVPYWHIDTGFAALLMLLTAVDQGLGACFFAVPAGRVDDVRAAFAVPE